MVGFVLLLSIAQATVHTAVLRQTFYTTEAQGEILVDLGTADSATVVIRIAGGTVATDQVSGPGIARAGFPLAGAPIGTCSAECEVKPSQGAQWTATVEVVKLLPKANEVTVDRLTGQFTADGLPLFPFGFYCYSPVQPTLPEEEFVRGFSMISPYQDLRSLPLADRHAVMDRCAALGMKVNYSLVSLSGGGSGKSLSDADRANRKLITQEINEFKDHPALLAWYLADEPDGQGISPAALEEEYRMIKEIDPYHPITMVFDTPALAPNYRNGLDVAMADPYPVPNSSPADAGDTIAGLHKAFGLDKPLWVVPQAFGGNEWWAREPTPQEIRLMTWQSILNGASGVQYFVRHGLAAFPKSPSMWAECGKMAEEVFELEPFLHSAEAAPIPTVDQPDVQARCWKANGQVLLALVNKRNAPAPVRVHVDTRVARARLPFENRFVDVKSGEVDDFVDGYGTRFYVFDESPLPTAIPGNSMVDPSFEENPTVGVPSGCYVGLATDRGATARVDPRVAHTGRHSVRLTAPSEGSGLTLGFYPVSLTPGKAYVFSVWARAAAGASGTLQLSVEPGTPASTAVTVGDKWTRCELRFTLPAGKDPVRTSASLRLASKGVAWIDDIAMLPAPGS